MTHLHSRFLSCLPRIKAYANLFFRYTRCAAKRADWIAEVIALAWKWFVKLEQRGKNAQNFVRTIAKYAVKAVKCGRRVTRLEKAKDAMNPHTQRRRGFTVEQWPDRSNPSIRLLTEALADDTVTPPPDAAAFRIDFPQWLRTLTARDRLLVQELMTGERPYEAAERFGVSRGRVSQLRREWLQDWLRFHGEPAAA